MNFEADGHIFGNFHAYYSFNPVHERLRFMDVPTTTALRRALLIKESTEDAADETSTIIDIGCNEGDLTIGLYNALTGRETLAPPASVPVDDAVSFDLANICTLNERVQKNKWQVEYAIEDHSETDHRRRYVCELQINDKVMGHGEGVSKKVAKAKAAEMALRSLDDKNQVQKEREEEESSGNSNGVLGQLPVTEDEPVMRKKLMVLGVDPDEALIERAANKPVQLDEGDVVQFRRVDVMTSKFSKEIAPFLELAERAAAKRKFDLVTCFSVTMWIHLNNGDDGLWKFLETVSDMTEHLLIEPQTWKCYRNARKRLNRRHVEVPQSFNEIKVRADVVEKIDAFLLAGRFRYKAQLGTTNWSRNVVLYSRKPVPGIIYVS
uniref:RNA methyltransferase n=1 Tax=Peronospora matthiolae TaxID=2874970 RepID=A0AAV1T6S1_9STRA